VVGAGQLRERVGLADLLPQLLADDLDLPEQRLVAAAIAPLGLEPAVAFLPLLADEGRRVGGVHGG
jgi:hypothetical protein